jgi:hypothetical protein
MLLHSMVVIRESVNAQDVSIALITRDSNKAELKPNYNNVLQIGPLPTRPRRATISISEGRRYRYDDELHAIGNDQYLLRVGQLGTDRNVRIQVTAGSQILASKTFTINSSGPLVHINGVITDTLSASALRANPKFKIEVKMNGNNLKVRTFNFSLAPRRGEYVGPFRNNGAVASNLDLIAAVLRCKAGDRIYVEEIEVDLPATIRSYQIPKIGHRYILVE